jgi:hypothetical protein
VKSPPGLRFLKSCAGLSSFQTSFFPLIILANETLLPMLS